MKTLRLSYAAVASFLVLWSANVCASDFNSIPRAWKWIGQKEVIFSYDGTYTDSTAFVFDAGRKKIHTGVTAPEKYQSFPVSPEGAVNMTYSPDSTRIAFTRDNDIYVVDIASGAETRLTFDGSDLKIGRAHV